MIERTNKTNAAAKGVLLTVLVRILSFALTQITNRLVKPKTLGNAALRLDLWCSTTVLFVGREGFRLALLRIAENRDENVDDDKTIHRRKILVNNVAWLSVPTGLCLTVLALTVHLRSYQNQVEENEFVDYKMAGILYCLATAIEVLTEPYTISCLRTLDITTRVKAEGVATIGKTLSCAALMFCVENGNYYTAMILPGPICAFGTAQLVYAVLAFGIMYERKRNVVEFPKWKLEPLVATEGEKCAHPPSNPYKDFDKEKGSKSWIKRAFENRFDLPTLRLSILFTLQSILKHTLTEGDRIVLSALVGSYDAGVYAIASSYGGIASRLLFQPLEENGRLLFSNLHASIVEKGRSISSSNEIRKDMEQTYYALMKFVLYVGLIFATFGSNYASVLLRLLAGKTWGSNPEAANVLSAFCSYTALLALNGMSEAFVYGVAESKDDIGSLSMAHALVGIIFYITAPILIKHGGGGTVGLVAANSLCMMLRSLYSLQFAAEYFGRQRKEINTTIRHEKSDKQPWWNPRMTIIRWSRAWWKIGRKILPHTAVMVCFFVSYMITRQSRLKIMKEADWNSNTYDIPTILSIETITHVVIGIGCIFVTMGIMFYYEGEYVLSLKSLLKSSRNTKSKIN